MSGWIKAHRVMTKHPIWDDKPFARGQAWIDLIFLASWKDGHFIKRGVKIEQEIGMVATSMKGLSDRWGWSIGKVKRFLLYLKTERQIETKIDNVTTLITIRNYDKYQGNGNQNGNQTETIEEVKEVISYLNEKTGRRFSTKTKPTKEAINARLKEGWTVEDFKVAIDNQVKEWTGTDFEKYLTPDTLFRPSKFEKYVNNTQASSGTDPTVY